METVLQVAGVVVPCFAALGGLFAWGLRRMDRRFEEARKERTRIEASLDDRCTHMEAKFDDRCTHMEAKFEDRCTQIEAKFDDRCSRMEERIDRLGDRMEVRSHQLSRQITELNRELGKLQGIVGRTEILDIAAR